MISGGVAAAEALLRLRTLADDLVQVTLVAANDEFVYRLLAVREAAGFGLDLAHLDKR